MDGQNQDMIISTRITFLHVRKQADGKQWKNCPTRCMNADICLESTTSTEITTTQQKRLMRILRHVSQMGQFQVMRAGQEVRRHISVRHRLRFMWSETLQRSWTMELNWIVLTWMYSHVMKGMSVLIHGIRWQEENVTNTEMHVLSIFCQKEFFQVLRKWTTGQSQVSYFAIMRHMISCWIDREVQRKEFRCRYLILFIMTVWSSHGWWTR